MADPQHNTDNPLSKTGVVLTVTIIGGLTVLSLFTLDEMGLYLREQAYQILTMVKMEVDKLSKNPISYEGMFIGKREITTVPHR